MRYTKEEWIEIGKLWVAALASGQPFKSFCAEMDLSAPVVSYNLRRLGFKVRLPGNGRLRGELCERRNHKEEK